MSTRRTPTKHILTHQTISQPSVDKLIADAMSTLELELLRLRQKAQRGAALLPDEGRLLNGYIKALTELAREDREQQKGTDLSGLSTEEIIKLLQNSPKQVTGRSDDTHD